jgi:hypothetical protein
MKRFATQYDRFASRQVTLASVLCLAVLGGCGAPEGSPEEQLRQWVSRSQAAAEDKQRGDLVDMIAPSYVDSRDHERGDIDNMLRAYFFRQHSIGLLTNIEEIRVYGDSAAEIDLTVGMAGSNDGVFGFSADAYRFQLELARDEDEWLLISARWAELGDELH